MNLAERAKSKNLVQAQIAVALGVSQGTLSKWLNGHTPVAQGKMRQLAEILELSLEDIVPKRKTEK